MTVRIKENSWLARLAAKKLRSGKVAMVIGSTIYLFNTSKADFLNDRRWLNHELAHVKQYQQYGVLRFLLLYLWESARKGYHQNRFEVEARAQETAHAIQQQFIIT